MAMFQTISLSIIRLDGKRRLPSGRSRWDSLVEAAPREGVRLGVVTMDDNGLGAVASSAPRALARALASNPDALLVDGAVAASLGPALRLQPLAIPLCGLVEQRPGDASGHLGRRVRRALELSVYRRAALLVVPSDVVGAELRAHGVTADRIMIIQPGHEPSVVLGRVRDSAKSSQRRIALLSVADWLPHEGIHHVLESFASLPRHVGTLHLAGDPTLDRGYSGRIRARLGGPDLAGRVSVHGPLPKGRLDDLYRASDVFVLASAAEPYGFDCVEAMSRGLPVVGFAAGNLPSLVTTGVEGLLVDVGDTLRLSQALRWLASDETLRRRMGEAARARARDLPSPGRAAADLFLAVRATVGLPRTPLKR